MTAIRIITDKSAYYISFALFTLWPTLVVMLCFVLEFQQILIAIVSTVMWKSQFGLVLFEISEVSQAKNPTSGKTATE